MISFLSSTISPKQGFTQTHPFSWMTLKFISNTSKPKDNSFTVSYLIDTCGFSPQRAASVSKYMNFKTREKPDSVIQFFKNLGFSQNTVLSIIRSTPLLLQTRDPDKAYLPKIDFFKSKGFSNSDILNVIKGFPTIVQRSLENNIIPSYDFFNNLFKCEHKLMKTVIRHSGILEGLNSCTVPNIKLLREEGVPESQIIRFVELFPRSLTVAPKQLKRTLEEVKKLDFDPSMNRFVVAIHVKICIIGSTWARKEGIYRRWGWTDDDIGAAFRLHPFFMAVSDDKIEGIMDFLVNKLSYEPSAIARCPVVTSMSLGKRIIPRGSVVQVLLSKGLVKQLKLSAIFMRVEKVFLAKFIYCHNKEAHELLKLYRAKLAHAEIKQKNIGLMNEMKK